MKARIVERVLWSAVACAIGLAAVGWWEATPALVPLPDPAARNAGNVVGDTSKAARRWRALDPLALERGVIVATRGNLFRPERRAADEAANDAATAEPASAEPPPTLTLRGTVGGPPWDAVLAGIPGHEGTVVVRAGDVVAGLTIRSVRRDTVVVASAMATWELTLGRPE